MVLVAVPSSLGCVELQSQVAELTSDLKEERLAGKRMKGEVQQLRDDLAETSAERDALQKARYE